MQRIPARIGDPLAAVDTPALVVDLDAFEHNLDLMANAVRGSGLALRPHAKAHKCPDIARRRSRAARWASAARRWTRPRCSSRRALATCSSPTRSSRLRSSRGWPRLRESPPSASSSTTRASRPFPPRRSRGHAACYVEIDVGAHRCGVAPGAAAGALAQALAMAPGLRFRGLHAYHGGAQHLRPRRAPSAIAAASACGGNEGADRGRRRTLSRRDGRGHRHVAARTRQPCLYGTAAGLVCLHGCRLRSQCTGTR